MFKLFGFTLYVSGLWPFAYVLLYLPLALGVLALVRTYWLRSISDPVVQKRMSWLVTALVLSVPLWDVLAISAKANYLCRTQGGIHVFKTASADSVLGGSIAVLGPHGFKFTESAGAGGYKTRYRLQSGKVIEERIDRYTARYSFGGDGYTVLDRRFAKTTEKIIDTENGEVLSNLVYFWVHPGLFDRILANALSSSIHWTCGDERPLGRTGRFTMDDLVMKTLIPATSRNGISQ